MTIGALIAVRLLLSYRAWMRDVLVEVYRVREMRILESVCTTLLGGVPPADLKVLDFGAGKGLTSGRTHAAPRTLD